MFGGFQEGPQLGPHDVVRLWSLDSYSSDPGCFSCEEFTRWTIQKKLYSGIQIFSKEISKFKGNFFFKDKNPPCNNIIIKRILIRRELTNEGKMYLEEKYEKNI